MRPSAITASVDLEELADRASGRARDTNERDYVHHPARLRGHGRHRFADEATSEGVCIVWPTKTAADRQADTQAHRPGCPPAIHVVPPTRSRSDSMGTGDRDELRGQARRPVVHLPPESMR
jgi:hypothetical protein